MLYFLNSFFVYPYYYMLLWLTSSVEYAVLWCINYVRVNYFMILCWLTPKEKLGQHIVKEMGRFNNEYLLSSVYLFVSYNAVQYLCHILLESEVHQRQWICHSHKRDRCFLAGPRRNFQNPAWNTLIQKWFEIFTTISKFILKKFR